jgi:FtsP/CotA-like multicopper oxidase with cupredoxin domain
MSATDHRPRLFEAEERKMTHSVRNLRHALTLAFLAIALPATGAPSAAAGAASPGAAAQPATAGARAQRKPTLQLRSMTNRDREAAAARARQRQGKPMSPRQRKLLVPTTTPGTPAAGATSQLLPGGAGVGAGRVAAALLDVALGQVGTADLYAVANFANSPLPVATCECLPGTLNCDPSPPAAPALGCIKDADCPGFATGATCTGAVVAGGIHKFVDQLATLCPLGKNTIGQCLPVATPDTTKFANSDYYELGVKDYTAQFHTDLPATTQVRGYYQKNVPAAGGPLDPARDAANPHYLGPIIIAKRGTPVRVLMTNEVTAPGLFIPTDHTVVGAGKGPLDASGAVCDPLDPMQNPNCASYSENRATLHLHGGNTPWISDGTQHQWTVPVAEAPFTPFKKGLTTRDVPDMPTGDGQMSFFWTNDQSGRMMFFHDHAYGITRLNVYAGEAAGYVLIDPVEEDGLASVGVPGTLAGAFDVGHYLPLVFQDKTFVPPPEQLALEDPTWDVLKWGGTGNLWFPHVYPPNQWPYAPDISGANPFGRWDYGPWFHPAQTILTAGQLEVPCYSAAVAPVPGMPAGTPNTMCPGIPNPTIVPESFLDTPLVNGTAYPTVTVEPTAYRFQILNAAQERNWNLSLFVADASGTEVPMVDAVPHTSTSVVKPCAASAPISAVTGLPFGPDLATPVCWPATWPTDGRAGGVPDPAAAGPAIQQIGTEGGLLPKLVVIPPQPVGFEYNRRNIVVLNVLNKSLFMGPAERADVVVDFSAYAGKTLIVYNDAPAPVPAFDSRYDYYTGDPDQTDTGGAPTTHAGYGPNTRTIMQIKVAPAVTAQPAIPYSAAAASAKLTSLFTTQQPPPVVPEAAYSGMYLAGTLPNTYFSIQATTATVTPIDTVTTTNPTGTPQVFTFGQKAIQELFDADYGRMNATLGVEMQLTNFLNQTTVPYANYDPATEFLEDTKPQIWKITHNGVDTHTIHFHLMNLQVVNRVGWDGAIRPPDPDELGWKESIRMHPLEDIYVAMKPVKMPNLPWPLPDMWRPLDVTLPMSRTTQFTGVDIANNPITVLNVPQNFGWEYVWHCHLLGHEENDMLRAEVFVVAPEAPTSLNAAGAVAGTTATVTLTWKDASASAMTFNVQRSTDPTFTAPLAPGDLSTFVTAPTPNGGTVTYLDTIAGYDSTATYYYRVQAEKQLTSQAIPATMQGSAALPYRAASAWVMTQLGASPAASVAPLALAFNDVLVGATASQTVTVSNGGMGNLVVGGVSLSATGAASFSQSNACGTIVPGGSCLITVFFAPKALGAAGSALTIATNDAVNPTFTVALTGNGIGPQALIAPPSLAFGSQLVGTTATAQTVTLTNTGTAPMSVSGPVLSGVNLGDFGQTTTCGIALAPGASCTTSVTFTPAAVGPRAASLAFTTNSLANPVQTVSLSGTGIAPLIGVSPASLAFGSLLVNNVSAAQSVTVSNTGTAPLAINAMGLSGTDAGQFGFVTNGCGASLAVGATCTFSVVFQPTRPGPLAAAVTIVSSDLVNPTLSVPLSGTGVGLNLSATSVAFGNWLVGTTSTSTNITLTNATTAPVTLSAFSLGGTNPNNFTFTTNCGTTLGAGAACRISLRFAPTAMGARSGLLNIPTSLSATPMTVALSGTGVSPVLTLSPTALVFPVQTPGTVSAAQVVTVSNTGNAPMTFTNMSLGGANPNQFRFTTTCTSPMPAATSCTISVRFAPTSPLTRTATLNVNVAAPGVSGSISLTGTGANPVLSLSAASLAFGTQARGTISAAQTVTVTNTGTGNLVINSINLRGTNANQFRQTNNCGGSVAAGASCTVTVRFAPSSAGAKSATLNVNVAAPATNGSVALTGTGL